MTEIPPLSTVGIHIDRKPVFFFDFDGEYSIGDIQLWAFKHSKEFDIYKTKHGYHLVFDVDSFDTLQNLLDETKIVFPKVDYIRNCRKLRIRISPKWDNVTGKEISSAPTLLLCTCKEHHDKRVGRLEIYATSD